MVQSIPTYTTAALQFPMKLCNQLDSVVRRFQWNPKTESDHFLTPSAWSTLCRSQKEGGLGFRNFWDFNRAILSKLAWWILPGKSCLCVNVLKAKCKVRHNWLNHYFLGKAFPVQKSLLGDKHLISKAACMLVEDGNSIRIWEDPQVPDLQGFIPTPKNGVDLNGILLVSQLFNFDFFGQDVHKLNWWFENSAVGLILKIPIFPTSNKDQWAQTYTSFGELSVKSAYWRCRESMQHNIDPFWNCIWKAKLHDKHKMMIWRIAAGCLPTKDKLRRFVDIGDVYCPLCRLETKTSLHLFALCLVAKVVWFNSKQGLRIDSFGFSSEVDFIQFLCSPPFTNQLGQKNDLLLFGAILCDGIWKLRNQVIFEDLSLEM